MCATPGDVFFQGVALNPFWKAGERRFLFAEIEQEVGWSTGLFQKRKHV